MCNHYKPEDDPEEMEFALNMTLVRLGIVPSDYLPGLEAYPKSRAPVVCLREDGAAIELMRWGVAAEIQGKTKFITNARNDKLLKGYPWRFAARERRCLIPARGYFEPGTGPVGARGEIYFSLKERPRFFIAGLWDTDSGENAARAFTMVTTEPNALALQFHDRMPVVLSNADALKWIGNRPLPDAELLALCRACPPDIMQLEHLAPKPKKKIAKDDLFGGELTL